MVGVASGEPSELRLLRINPDVMGRLGLGRTTVYEEIAAGRLPVVKIGRCVRVRSDDLARWIEERTQASRTAA